MINQVQKEVREILSTAKSPALFCSFGKDSLLLLHLAREVNPDIPIFYFGDELTNFAEEVVKREDLTVWNYAPADRYIIPNGDGLALIDEYSLRDVRFPVVTPIVEGENCKHAVPELRTFAFNYRYDVTLWGYKQNETCEAVSVSFSQEINLGTTRLIAPLFNWTDDQVLNALQHLNIPYIEESDEMEFCSDCLSAIINSEWDKEASLMAFRNKFGLVTNR